MNVKQQVNENLQNPKLVAERKAYARPQLEEFGRLGEIVRGVGSFQYDLGGFSCDSGPDTNKPPFCP